MSWAFPKKRTLLAWHRWVGFASAFFLISLSITGLALNHTERLKLDQITLHNGWVLNQYGMSSGSDLITYQISDLDTLSYLDGQLFFNQSPLTATDKPVGIVLNSAFTTIVCENALIYITEDGELIEKLELHQLPFESRLLTVGKTETNQSVLVTTEGTWTTDTDWIEFTPYVGSYQVDPMPRNVSLNNEQQNALLTAFQGEGISLYRLLLDLHSGRLFGWGGRTLMDLTAVAILLLIASGLLGHFRRNRRKPTA